MDLRNLYMNRGAEPFFHRGGPDGCLCIHGFSATPAEVKWLGEHLASKGMTVYGPRLSGHGVNPEDMRRMRWQDWYATVRDGLEILQRQCDRVYLAGISMGGILALLLASAEEVDGLAVMAAPLYLDTPIAPYAHLLKYVIPMWAMPDRTMLPQRIREEQDRRGEQVVGRVHYDRWSVSAFAQLYELGEFTRDQLAGVTAPSILIYSEQDKTVPIENSHYIARHISSNMLESHVLYNSGHILTQDIERERVFALIAQFFAKHGARLKDG